MLPHRTLLALILLSALLTAGCGELISNLKDVRVVQAELTKKFDEEVSVNTGAGEDGVMLVVWFINSPLNDDSAEKRVLRATEAADVVKKVYPRIQNVREIWIGFLRKKSRFAVFHESQIVAVHGFDKNGGALPGRNDNRYQAPTDIQVTATYSPSNNDTDIAVNGLQLEGQPGGFGLTVLPYFKLIGDARSGKRLRPPKIVEVNFASYSDKPTFKPTVPITFVVDKKVALKIDGDFIGNDSQFCYLRIPYPEFRRIVSGEELTIKLGDKEYRLAPSQLGAMKEMTHYVLE